MAFESLKAKYAEYKKKRDTEKIAKEREKSELESEKEKARIEAREQFSQESQARSVEEAKQNELNKEKAKEDAIKEAKEKEKARLEAPERRKKAFKEGVKKAETGFWKAIDTATEKAVAYGKKEFKGKPTHRKHKIRKIPIHFSGKYPEVQWAKRRSKHKSRTSHKRSTRRKRDDGGWFLG
jgi:hypothetical protein